MYRIVLDTGEQYDIDDDKKVEKKLYKNTFLGKELKDDLVEIEKGVFINPKHIIYMEHYRKMYNLSRRCYQYIK